MHHCLLYYQFFLLFLLTHFPQTEPAEYVVRFFLFYTPLSLFSTNLKVVTQVTSLHISQSEGLTTLQQNWVVGNALLWQLLFAGPWGRELLFFFFPAYTLSPRLSLCLFLHLRLPLLFVSLARFLSISRCSIHLCFPFFLSRSNSSANTIFPFFLCLSFLSLSCRTLRCFWIRYKL